MKDIFKENELRIARQTLRMPDAMVGVMGGPDKAEAARTLAKAEVELVDFDDPEAERELKQQRIEEERELEYERRREAQKARGSIW